MIRKTLLVGLLAVFALLSTAPAIAADAKTARIAVIDTSGSMAGARLDTVKQELAEHGAKLPPSPDHPLVVVLFDHEVREVRSFIDEPSFQQYLKMITIRGGTSIASGLQRAVQESRVYAMATHIVVLLYTDGEDGDQCGIKAAEEELNRLFAARSQVGLGQTVVFCKRWGGANADLMANIAKRGLATVIDGGETALCPVVLTPQVQVKQAKWSTTHPGELDVACEGWMRADGSAPAGTPPVRLSCRTANGQGDLTPNFTYFQTTPFSVRVPVSKADAEAKQTQLDISAIPPGAAKGANGLVWPILPQPSVKISVPLPPPARAVYTVGITPAAPATWADPLAEIAHLPLTVSISVQPAAGEAVPAPQPFEITCEGDYSLVKGSARVTVSGSGTTTHAVTLKAGPSAIQASTPGPIYQPKLTITPRDVPVCVHFLPTSMQVPVSVPVPPPSRTTVTAKILSAKCLGWNHVGQGTAAFQADAEIQIQGIVGNTAGFSPHSADLTGLRFVSPTWKAGTQRVRLTGEVKFATGATELSAQWTLAVPKRQGAVEWVAPPPIPIRLTVPPPARLILRSTDPRQKSLAASMPAFADSMVWTAQLDVLGVIKAERAGVTGSLQSTSSSVHEIPQALAAPSPVNIRIRMSEGPRSFFRDSITRAEIVVEPQPANPRVVGGTFPIQIHQEAPFKQLLFYLVTGLAAIGTVFCIVRSGIRLTQCSDLRSPCTVRAAAGR